MYFILISLGQRTVSHRAAKKARRSSMRATQEPPGTCYSPASGKEPHLILGNMFYIGFFLLDLSSGLNKNMMGSGDKCGPALKSRKPILGANFV